MLNTGEQVCVTPTSGLSMPTSEPGFSVGDPLHRPTQEPRGGNAHAMNGLRRTNA